MNIPEAAVEAATKARYIHSGEPADQWSNEQQSYRDFLAMEPRIHLEAAAPHIAAQALRDAADRAFKNKQLHGLQRVLIGTYLRECAAEMESTP